MNGTKTERSRCILRNEPNLVSPTVASLVRQHGPARVPDDGARMARWAEPLPELRFEFTDALRRAVLSSCAALWPSAIQFILKLLTLFSKAPLGGGGQYHLTIRIGKDELKEGICHS
jgi:hypothetical protein